MIGHYLAVLTWYSAGVRELFLFMDAFGMVTPARSVTSKRWHHSGAIKSEGIRTGMCGQSAAVLILAA
jgi:hypothetical protein